MAKVNLLGLSAAALADFCIARGAAGFHGRQIFRWMHRRGVYDFGRMSDLPAALRSRLEQDAVACRPRLAAESRSFDGCRKWLFAVGERQDESGEDGDEFAASQNAADCSQSLRGSQPPCDSQSSRGSQYFRHSRESGNPDGASRHRRDSADYLAENRAAAPHRRFAAPPPPAAMDSRFRGNDDKKDKGGNGANGNGVNNGGAAVEAVLIPEARRATLCVSTQVGCALACGFCRTGVGGFVRNLSAAEIIGQLAFAREAGFAISNVVMMGMGEPLLNLPAVLPALEAMIAADGWGLSRRRVTVSTAGIVPGMDRLRARCPVALAVSLHAADDDLRDALMPINRRYPIAALLAACRRYLADAPRDFITFEYAPLAGVNDSPAQAARLLEVLREVPAKINLIPFNPFAGARYRPSPLIRAFRDRLVAGGMTATIRKTRGDDINAACGQLAGRIEDGRIIRFAADRRAPQDTDGITTVPLRKARPAAPPFNSPPQAGGTERTQRPRRFARRRMPPFTSPPLAGGTEGGRAEAA